MNHFESVQIFYSYKEFSALMNVLAAEGKTTGPVQSESLTSFTRLNHQRIQRWDKTFQLNEILSDKVKHVEAQIWWVITEAWCGDGAQCLPAIEKMVEASNGNIQLRIILRDENLSIMDEYLTNGSRSIPKLIAINNSNDALFTWGPRPAVPQKMMMDWKAGISGKSHDDVEKDIHAWYAKDKGQSLQQEFFELLNK